jgi:gliding motility-associated-like protein
MRLKALVERWSVALLSIGSAACAHAQTNISGVVNSYQPVTAITPNGCLIDLEVSSAAGFMVNDSVVIIQMKGAIIDSSNSASFGTIISLNGAGNYEIKRISAINGNTITLAGPLLNTYDVDGLVQLVSFPTYADANVTATLSAADWNGSTGGVLAFRVWDQLTLNADIDLDGKGFRGGTISNNPDGACGTGSPNYYYDLFQGGVSWQYGGAEKGEGVATISSVKRGGKGPLGNGGGGGNKHNFGGGGGGNYTSGGLGGGVLQGCPMTGDAGIGGVSLAGAINTGALFLGGGGGRGDDNNNAAQPGTDGGGIIIILANTLTGNGHVIRSNGVDLTIPGALIADGNGGGGAGGTILLSVAVFNGALTVQADGGNGGDQQAAYCVGPGGGGGQGAVVSCGGPLPANVSVITDPGLAGLFTQPGFSCTNTTYGAEDGMADPSDPVQLTGCFPAPASADNLPTDVISDATLCPGDTIFLDPVTAGANYLWSDGTNDTLFVVSSTNEIWVISSSDCADPVVDSAMVTVGALTPVLDYVADAAGVCPGDTIEVDPMLPGASYLWQDGTTDPFIVANESGSYSVEVTLGCDTVSDPVVITVLAEPTLDLGPDTVLCADQRMVLVADGFDTYLWDDSSSTTIHAITGAGVHHLTATDGCGHMATDTVVVSAKDCDCYFYVPNTFTPEGDGINEGFGPVYQCEFLDYTLMIFDRWGELIFGSADPQQRWDGSYGGSIVKLGVYVYRVKYRPIHGNGQVEHIGHVTVLR